MRKERSERFISLGGKTKERPLLVMKWVLTCKKKQAKEGPRSASTIRDQGDSSLLSQGVIRKRAKNQRQTKKNHI